MKTFELKPFTLEFEAPLPASPQTRFDLLSLVTGVSVAWCSQEYETHLVRGEN